MGYTRVDVPTVLSMRVHAMQGAHVPFPAQTDVGAGDSQSETQKCAFVGSRPCVNHDGVVGNRIERPGRRKREMNFWDGFKFGERLAMNHCKLSPH